MQKVLDFLAANPVFQLATVDGEKARCRPFGFHIVDGGRLYFFTGVGKNVHRQLNEKPWFELSVSNDKGEWMRLSARAVFDTKPELVEKSFEMMPMLRDIYGEGGKMKPAMFYAADGEVTFADMQGNSQTLPL